MEYQEIGGRIKDRRKALGMSAVDLAARVALSKATIHRYENGDIRNIKLPVVESIARELRVNPLWIIGKSQDMELQGEPAARYMSVESVLDDVIAHVRATKGLLYGGRQLSAGNREAIASSLETIRRLLDLRYK